MLISRRSHSKVMKGAEPPAGVTTCQAPDNMTYKEFLANKRFVLESSGFDIDKSMLNPMLYDFQKDIVRWALKKGKACIFADCGLGKTPMQLSWAYQVHKHTHGKILILAPLAVADQTKREAEKFGLYRKSSRKAE